MPSLLSTTVATNYGRLAGPGYTESGQARTYTVGNTQFGTRQLTFIKCVQSGGTTYDLTTTPDASNSKLSLAVRTIQQFAEIYAIGAPATSGGLSFTAVISADTANGADSGNTQAATYGLLEAALQTATGSTTWTVTEVSLNGITLA